MGEGFMSGGAPSINGKGGDSGDAFSGSDFTQSNSWGSTFNVGSGSASGGVPSWLYIVVAVVAVIWIFKRK